MTVHINLFDFSIKSSKSKKIIISLANFSFHLTTENQFIDYFYIVIIGETMIARGNRKMV